MRRLLADISPWPEICETWVGVGAVKAGEARGGHPSTSDARHRVRLWVSAGGEQLPATLPPLRGEMGWANSTVGSVRWRHTTHDTARPQRTVAWGALAIGPSHG